MSVSAVSNPNWLYTNYLSTLNQSSCSATNSNSQVSGNQSNSGGNDTLMESIMQAFGQVGLSIPSPLSGPVANSNPATGASVASTESAASTSPTGSAHHSRHALGKFMHDLFSAVESESGADESSTSSTAASPYSSFSSKLEQLISQLGTGSGNSSTSTTSSTNSTLSTLQSDFNNLVSSLSGNSSSNSSNSASSSASATSATTPDLTTFLQDVLTNLGTSATTSTMGNFMDLYS